MTFEESISNIKVYNTKEFINTATHLLPSEMKRHPWTYVNHGIDLLNTDNELNAYVAAYGEMHEYKCRVALQGIDLDKITNLEVWDWGCGQGIASMSLIDKFKENRLEHLIRKIVLVEPSAKALERAKINISKSLPSVPVITINKFLPGKNSSYSCIKQVNYTNPTIIHLFSNILDIRSIDINQLAELIDTTNKKQLFLCSGPLNKDAYRIDEFANLFKKRKALINITSPKFGYTTTLRKSFSCKINCFSCNDNFDIQKEGIESHCNINYVSPLKDDYDIEGIFKTEHISSRLLPFYNRLENAKELDEKDSIFIKPTINGEAIDFILIRPHKGVLILKVYTGKLLKDNIINECHAITDFRDHLMKIHMKDMWGKILSSNKVWSTVMMGIISPNYSCKEINNWLIKDKDNSLIDNNKHIQLLGYDALSDEPEAKKIADFIPIYNKPFFDDITYKHLLQLISPDWHTAAEGCGIKLDSIQKSLAKYNAESKQINGISGSGKTQVLVQRAVNSYLSTGQDVLILTFNITLANYIKYRLNQVKEDFSRRVFEITSYHRFFKVQAQNLGKKPTKKNLSEKDTEEDEFLFSYDDINFFNDRISSTKRYQTILIDEVQDYKNEWIEILKTYFLKEQGEIVVFGDAYQNIYHRPVDKKGQIKINVARNGWNNSLKQSHRSKNQNLIDFEKDFKSFFLEGKEIEIPTIQRSIFKDMQNINCYWISEEHHTDIPENCEWLIREYSIIPENLAIISNDKYLLMDIDYVLRNNFQRNTITTFASKETLSNPYAKSESLHNLDMENIDRNKKIHFTIDNKCIKISTIHSFKGWECDDIVLIIDKNENNSELIYTAISRAKNRLFIFNCENKTYNSFFSYYAQNQ